MKISDVLREAIDFGGIGSKKTQDNTKQFEKMNVGKVKASGVKKLVQQLEAGTLKYMDFPEWVLETWASSDDLGALPLKNNRWLDVKYVVTHEDELIADNLVYSGFVTDSNRKNEAGPKAISLGKGEDIDQDKYKMLVMFKKAVLEAKKILERLQSKDENDEEEIEGTPTEDTTDIPTQEVEGSN